MPKRLLLLLPLLLSACDAATPAPPARLGHAVTEQEIAAWNIDVSPGNGGLPPGRGTVAEGRKVYANACGWALARAHAKASNPWTIAGYLGKQGSFDEALGKFALAYADQAERDYDKLRAAVRAGLIDVELER